MNMPFFSIVVPIYKIKKEYLDTCVQSILCQTDKDFELILVDDGSPDNAGVYCDQYAAEDNRIRVIHQENQGVSAARNHGIEAACGEWILFIDADDWIEQNSLAVIREYLFASDVDVLQFDMVREKDGKSIPQPTCLQYGKIYDLQSLEDKEYLYRRFLHNGKVGGKLYRNLTYSCDKVYRRSVLMENGVRFPVGIRKSEDKIFVLRCAQHIKKYICVAEPLYHYRTNPDSICNRYSKGSDADRRKMAKIAEEISREMDHELQQLSGNEAYHVMQDAYRKYIFGLIPDVLFLEFYHKDNPNKATRRRDAIAYLRSEPFFSVIKGIPYSELSKQAKLKKFLLEHGFVNLYVLLKGKG